MPRRPNKQKPPDQPGLNLTDAPIEPDPRVYRPHDLILNGDGHRALDREMDEAIERDR